MPIKVSTSPELCFHWPLGRAPSPTTSSNCSSTADKAMRKGQEKWRENKKCYLGHLPWIPMFWLSKMPQPPSLRSIAWKKMESNFNCPSTKANFAQRIHRIRATKIPRAASQSESCTCCSSCAIGACSMLLKCYAPGSPRHKQPRKAKDCFQATPKIR